MTCEEIDELITFVKHDMLSIEDLEKVEECLKELKLIIGKVTNDDR